MKKVYMYTLLLLAGCMMNSIHSVGTKNPLFKKHYEDQLADNEISVTEYLDAIETSRAQDPEWKVTSSRLRQLRANNMALYNSVEAQVLDLAGQYARKQMNWLQFQAQVKKVIADTFRNN